MDGIEGMRRRERALWIRGLAECRSCGAFAGETDRFCACCGAGIHEETIDGNGEGTGSSTDTEYRGT